MPTVHFYQVDVFTRQAFGGNQLAVFADAAGLSTDDMQALTREMNFSESTFVLPPEIPGADWKVRIFTPAVEMPMAGHPTVGTAALLAHLGRIAVPPQGGQAVLELGIGAVPVIYEPAVDRTPQPGGLPFVWMTHRQPQFGPVRTDRAAVAAALGLNPVDLRADLPLQTVSSGVPFLFVPLTSLDAARRACSERGALAGLFTDQTAANVALFTEEVVDPRARVHCRMYSPHVAGIVEDPATGSMAAPLGAYLARHGLLPDEPVSSFAIEQGLEMLRPSRIYIEVGRVNGEIVTLRIGGDSVLVGEGTISW